MSEMKKALVALVILVLDQGIKLYWLSGGSVAGLGLDPVQNVVLRYNLSAPMLFAVWLCLISVLMIINKRNRFSNLTIMGMWLVAVGTGSNVFSWLSTGCIVDYIVITRLNIVTNIADLAALVGFGTVLLGWVRMSKAGCRVNYPLLSKVIR